MAPSGRFGLANWSLSPLAASDDLRVMSTWREEFQTCTLEEILEWQVENREWGKENRREVNAIVNRRLAKEITFVEYLANRKRADEDAAECRRRAAILEDQIHLHTVDALSPGT